MQTLQALEVYDDFSPSEALDADIARALIDANRWYQLSGSRRLDKLRRLQARERAQQVLDKILARSPETADAINLRGRIALDEGKLQEARQLIEQAIQLDPTHASFWCNRGFVSLLQKAYDQAEAYFNQALTCDAGSVQAFSAIALCYYLREDYLGAFLRYRSLLHKGALNQTALTTLAECCHHLHADRYDESLEQDVLALYAIDHFEHQKLGALACSLLKYKYDLTNPACQLDIDALARDQLLLAMLATGSLRDVYVEDLVGLLRQHIVIEVAQTGALRDAVQDLCIGIALLGAHTDYVLNPTQEESRFVEDLEILVRDTLQGNWQPEDVAGALIIISMYKQLYNTNYSYRLLALELSDWPIGMQAMLEQNLYIKSDLHAIRFTLPRDESTLARNFDSAFSFGAYPSWQQLPYNPPASYASALSAEVGKENVPLSLWRDATCMLIIGCGSGERAIRLAKSFENIHIIGLDPNEDNIAYARYQAKQWGLKNVEFNVFHETDEIVQLGCLFDMVEIHGASAFDEKAISAAKALLDTEGLIRLSFDDMDESIKTIIAQLQKVNRLPTASTLRDMRSEAIRMALETPNHPLLNQDWFYHLSGCKARLFSPLNESQAALEKVIASAGLRPVSRWSAGENSSELKVYSKVVQ